MRRETSHRSAPSADGAALDSLYVSESFSSPPAVVVDSVSKTFAVPRERVHTLKERALHPFRGRGEGIAASGWHPVKQV